MKTHNDAPRSTASARALTAREQLSLALDGALPVGEVRASDAYRAALWMDRDATDPVLDHLHSLGRAGIVTLSGPFDPLHRLLSVLGIAHTVAGDMADVTESAKIVVLGCRPDSGGLNGAIESLKNRRLTLLTSDKSALLRALSGVLRPKSPCPGRIARLEWEPDISDDRFPGLLPGVRLAAGYVPIDIAESTPLIRILARDVQTCEPLMVVARVANLTVVHSVAHWWQAEPLGRSAVDTRLLSDIPGLGQLGCAFPTVRYGELQAARAMLSGLMLGIADSFAVE